MKKSVQFISFLFCMLIFTVACSNNENADSSSNKNEQLSNTTKYVELTISAAASLKNAMEVIQRTYQEEHPDTTLTFNFGSSGALQQQISQGAPVDLFFSAAEEKFDYLVEEGLINEEDGIDLLGNSLVLVIPKNESSINSFEDLTKSEIDSISIGTYETVPAGKYAKEALEKMGIWEEIESKIVFAKDVRQVLSYVETGNVDAGLVYKTDALNSDKVEIVASADPAIHGPIIYPIGIIKNTKHYEEAKKFYEYLQSDHALKVFEEYGFTIK
ncbi:molybdate ABC transporter substrate-binding protein [Calidifontibacillus erzurumensis]|uniref:Molybdate ABC transporter substrate-binding protein n=1 Tax=Calidifontibacillus erzurumensis TaxID=2741433 RepID=A0A8J8GHG7_9BACI|nr:molybdate ABC transporter substrate-binding protein [Calidifontibacillus erzurumensis]NSL53261.1 molybdate ABC transporter substrate-binding protein [Calidifontibacillus erzurumensis]